MIELHVKLKNQEGFIRMEVKRADLKATLEDIRTVGVSQSEGEWTYYWPAEAVEWVRGPRER